MVSESKNSVISIQGNCISFQIPTMAVEIEGVLVTSGVGRNEVQSFEPNYFANTESSNYFDVNWEVIGSVIIDEYNK